ncbi:PAS domain S-box protein [Oleiagrimonas sp. C23AA]|uniref:PAS domain S-box protein n=1 Tax=Oleiagrimonas sp. C23AA TaxID=2719047 RepID=UPI00141F9F5C|nr:PAS domain S-box protein [Oleiagrimonas sp. C23AA]NII09313.1 PAS domain S-box protein [Oleiagrimonas sp. C23AA]
MDAPFPDDEAERLRALYALGVLDTDDEPEYSALARIASLTTDMPVALVTFIDARRQWLKANVGLPGVQETPRDVAFCAHTIAQEGVFEVVDASADPRFADNPMVAGDAHVRAYAGAPITLRNGQRVGAVCVIDRQPKQLSDHQKDVLLQLAASAASTLDARRTALQSSGGRGAHLRRLLTASNDAVLSCDSVHRISFVNDSACQLLGLKESQMLGRGLDAVLSEEVQADQLAEHDEWLQSGTATRYEALLVPLDGHSIPVTATLVPHVSGGGKIDGGYTKIYRDLRPSHSVIRQIAQSEARFKTLSAASPLGVFQCNAEGDCEYVNARWLEMAQLQREQVMGRGWLSPLHPDDAQRVRERWRRARDAREEFADEFRIRRIDGDERHVRVRVRPLLEETSQLSGFVGTVEDITESRRVALELAQAKDSLRRFYESTPAMLYVMDHNGHLVYVSDTWCERLGYSREEVLGRRSVEFFTQRSREHAESVGLPHVFAQGYAERLPYQMLDRQGRCLDVELSAVLHRDAEGHPRHVVTILDDVTERKRAERALKSSHERLEYIIDATRAGTWEINLRTGEVFCNHYWAQLAGYSLEELSSLTFPDGWAALMHEQDYGLVREVFNKHVVERTDFYECELRLRHRDGPMVWVLERGRVATWSADGCPERVFGIHLNIDQRKKQEAQLRKSEALLDRTGRVAGIGGWELDLDSREVQWSEQTYRIHGLEPGSRVQVSEALQFYAPEARPVIEQALTRSMETGEGWDLELPFIKATGERVWVRAMGQVQMENGRPSRLIGALQDISASYLMRQELARQHELLDVTLASIGDGVVTTDAKGRITWMNPVAERLSGWVLDDVVGRPLNSVLHMINEETRRAALNPVDVCLRENRAVGLEEMTVLIARDGSEYGIEDSASPIRRADGEVLGAVMVFHDVTEQRRLSREMSHRAQHDALTGLLNRTEFEARLARLWSGIESDSATHALAFIDLDQFKIVNDTCGHAEGDRLLRQVAKLLTSAVRQSDTVARLGGDEFAVLMPRCPLEGAERVAATICTLVDNYRFAHEERVFRVGASIGLVSVDARWASVAAIQQAADAACYTAKENGRNRYEVWRESEQSLRARHGDMQWTSRIEQALQGNAFELYVQPIVAVDALHGRKKPGADASRMAEVLLRLPDGEGGVAAAAAFMPAVERFHFASRVDRWVLSHVLEWLAAGDSVEAVTMLTVNISGQSLGDRAFHAWALQMLREAGAATCRRLCIEITETAVVTHLADAAEFFLQCKELGVRVALDDFGAGSSSFGYLKRLKVDFLKIDGQFVRGMVDDPLDEVAVRCFAEAARVSRSQTIAEYVETPAVVERLHAVGVDFAQGYLPGRPMPLTQWAPGEQG